MAKRGKKKKNRVNLFGTMDKRNRKNIQYQYRKSEHHVQKH